MDTLITERLVLRRWQPADAAPMAAINRDPEVARYLNRPVDEASIEAFHGLMTRHWDTHGYGPWALESREPGRLGEFLGFAGLAHVPPMLAAAGTNPELGWRLARSAWGRGLATEAAVAARDDAFGRLGLPALISIIHPENVRSQRVARKLGMQVQKQIENPVLQRTVDVWGLTSPTGLVETPESSAPPVVPAAGGADGSGAAQRIGLPPVTATREPDMKLPSSEASST